MKVYNPNREERAFLYQEAMALEPLVKDIGSLSVMVEEVPSDHAYRVTFLVAPETFGMRVQATHDNLFEATVAAKEETLRQLNSIVNALPEDSDDADHEIPPQLLH